MTQRSFSELYQEAERHQDYWIAGAILEFTESVAREMARQGLTRTALAARLGATPAYVTKILRGKANFTLATMVRLSRALGSELHVRVGVDSRRQVAREPGEPTRTSTARTRQSSTVVTAASRQAALQTRQSPPGKPRRAAAKRTRTPVSGGPPELADPTTPT
jgi:plasmid maintenance system antidote protein VapI